MEKRWRILVVDDDPDILDLIRMKLSAEYDILCVDQATEVSQAVDLFEPDLIILDIMLPKISGYQVIEFLKRNPKSAQTPVCFLSAKDSARDLKHGYSLGAQLYLTKPFQPERLIKNIRLFFDRMPPSKPKSRTIEQINEELTEAGAYQVATAESEIPAREPSPRESPATPPEEEEDEDDRRRARWVD